MAVHEDQGLLQSRLVLSPQNWSVPHVQYLVIRVHRIQHLHDMLVDDVMRPGESAHDALSHGDVAMSIPYL